MKQAIFIVILMILFVPIMNQSHAQDTSSATIVVDGDCTLTDAIIAANTDTEIGSCVAGDEDDVIELTDDVVLTEIVETIAENDAVGLPIITSTITLQGNEFTIRRDEESDDFFRLLFVSEDGNLTLNNLTLSGGHVESWGVIDGEFEMVQGGAIYNNGMLTIEDSIITGNIATQGGGLFNNGVLTINNTLFEENRAESGAGLYNDENGIGTLQEVTLEDNSALFGGGLTNLGMITILESTLEDNEANNQAGAILNNGTLIIEDSTLTDNTAELAGGAIENNGELTINSSQLTLNTVELAGDAFEGGGAILNNEDGILTITDSTFFNNLARTIGGAIANFGELNILGSTFDANITEREDGGAIYMDTDDTLIVIIHDSTFTSNRAGRNGGVMYIEAGTLEMTDCELNENHANGNAAGMFLNGTVSLINVNARANTGQGSVFVINGNVTIDGGNVLGQ